MAYGIIKVDTITFTDGGIDKSVSISGLVQNPTFSGNVTVTGTISGNIVRGQTVSGNTVTGTTAQFTSGTFTNITGGVATITSGVFASGSAAAPSVSVGTTDNGIYSPGTDQVAISTNGTGRLYIATDGKIGVNVGSPTQAQLVVASSAGANTAFFTDGTNSSIKFLHGGSGAVITTENGQYLGFGTSDTERLRITSDGKLGLGTSSPGYLLDVAGDSRISGTNGLRIEAGGTGTQLYNNSGGTVLDSFTASTSLRFLTQSTERARIDSSGRLGVGTASPLSVLDVQTNAAERRSIRFSGTGISNAEIHCTESGGYNRSLSIGGQEIGFFTDTGGATTRSERARIDSSGRLGIGTTSPGATLHTVNTSAGAATVGAFIQNSSLTVGTEVRLGFAPNSNLVSDNRYSWIAGVNDTGSNGSSLTFATTPGGQGATEKMRIDGSGRLGVGTTSPGAILETRVDSAGGAPLGALLTNSSATANTSIGIAFQPNISQGNARYAIIYGINESGGSGNATGLAFHTNGNGSSPSERARIDSSGRLGIGTTSPAKTFDCLGDVALSVATNGTRTLAFRNSTIGTDYATIQYADASGLLTIKDSYGITFNGASEWGRWDASGRLLVGISTARSNFFNTSTYSPGLQLEGVTDQNRFVSIVGSNSAGAGGTLILASQKSGSIGGNAIVSNGGQLGVVSFHGNDGTEFVEAARIQVEVDGTPGANDMPGRLVFSTTADGAASPTERMRIASNGDIGFGNNVDFANLPGDGTSTAIGVAVDGGILKACRGQYAMQIGVNDTGANKILAQFFQNGTACGSIQVSNSNATAYVTSSDYRLKENLNAIDGAIDKLQLLKPCSFNFKNNPEVIVQGFIAHEVQDVVPEAIAGEKDEVDADGNPVYQGIDQSKLVPLLTAALQEAVAKIESLEARLTAAGI